MLWSFSKGEIKFIWRILEIIFTEMGVLGRGRFRRWGSLVEFREGMGRGRYVGVIRSFSIWVG